MRKVKVGRVGESNEGKMGITTTKKKKEKSQIKTKSETIILILPNHHKLENKLGLRNLCISCKLCKLCANFPPICVII